MAPPVRTMGRVVAKRMGQILPFGRPGSKEKPAERPVPSPDAEALRPPKTRSDAQTIRMNHWTDRIFGRFAELSRWLNTRFPQSGGRSDYTYYPATAEPVRSEAATRGDAVNTAAASVGDNNSW